MAKVVVDQKLLRDQFASEAEDADDRAEDREKCARTLAGKDGVAAKRYREMAYHYRIVASIARGDRDESGVSPFEAAKAADCKRQAEHCREMADRIEARDPARAARDRIAAEHFDAARDLLSAINPRPGKEAR